jgi:hypothetical protein
MRLRKILPFLAGLLVIASTSFAQSTAISVTFSSTRLVFSSDADQVVSGTMTNTSDDTVVISFARKQWLPKGWGTSVCFGSSCYASQVDTASEAFFPHESRELILHVNPRMLDRYDSGLVFVRIRAETGNIADTVSFLIHAIFAPGEPPIIFQKIKSDSGVVYMGDGPFVYSATFQNRSADSAKFAYHLSAQMPEGWTASLCIRDSCGSSDIRYPMAPLLSQAVRIRLQNTGTPWNRSDSAVFYLTVKPQTANPADSLQYRFVARLEPKSGVAESSTFSNTLMLGQVFPNPASGDVDFAVQTGVAAACSLVLYDPAGHVIVQLPLGHVETGMSNREISLRNVEPGTYFARISDGSVLSNPVMIRVTR